MSNFLDAVGANPISDVKKKDSVGTKFLKNTADAAVNRAALTPLLGLGPLAVAGPVLEGAAMTAVDIATNKSIWNSGPIMKAIGRDLGIVKMPQGFHSKTEITPGPGQMTQDQKNLQNLMKIADQQQQQLKEVGKNLGDVMNDLYGDGPADPGNNYGETIAE